MFLHYFKPKSLLGISVLTIVHRFVKIIATLLFV